MCVCVCVCVCTLNNTYTYGGVKTDDKINIPFFLQNH